MLVLILFNLLSSEKRKDELSWDTKNVHHYNDHRFVSDKQEKIKHSKQMEIFGNKKFISTTYYDYWCVIFVWKRLNLFSLLISKILAESISAVIGFTGRISARFSRCMHACTGYTKMIEIGIGSNGVASFLLRSVLSSISFRNAN